MPEVQRNTQSSAELTQTFLQFVMMQTQQALLAFGKHPTKPPGSVGTPPPNIELGGVFLSHLITIRFKTDGNLNPDEKMALDNAINHLQAEYSGMFESKGEFVSKPQPLSVGSVQFGGTKPAFILGPCVIESEEFVWEMARDLKTICDKLGTSFVFKASYDKANRTSVSSYRGLGVEKGCEILAAIGRELKVPVTTDVHSPEEAKQAAKYIDILQIPAFLCRQTDLIQAAAETGRVVNVKKGQFLAPWDMRNIAQKLRAFGCEKFMFTERGCTFGYNNLVSDMRSLFWMREDGFLTVFDATHSVQRPGGGGDKTSGDGILAPVLARAAVASGCDAVFIETHRDPSKAMSDGPNQIPLGDLPQLLETLTKIHALVT